MAKIKTDDLDRAQLVLDGAERSLTAAGQEVRRALREDCTTGWGSGWGSSVPSGESKIAQHQSDETVAERATEHANRILDAVARRRAALLHRDWAKSEVQRIQRAEA
jgi:hypothetical protein